MKHITLPKFPHPSKKSLLVTLGVVVFLSITVFGIVRQEQANKAVAAQAAADHAAQVAKDKQTLATIDGLKAENTTLKSNVNASCVYLNSLVQAKSTKGFVTVPSASGCPNPKK